MTLGWSLPFWFALSLLVVGSSVVGLMFSVEVGGCSSFSLSGGTVQKINKKLVIPSNHAWAGCASTLNYPNCYLCTLRITILMANSVTVS